MHAVADLDRRKDDNAPPAGNRLSDRGAIIDHKLALLDSICKSIANSGEEIRQLNAEQAA